MFDYGYKKYSKIKPIGCCILIEKMNEADLRKSHGLYVPESSNFKNNKIGIGKIIDISKKAKDELKIDINDYVLYDYFSVFDDKGKYVLTKYENIIMKLDEDEANRFLIGELWFILNKKKGLWLNNGIK